MTTLSWINSAEKTLSAAGIGTARLDVLVLLEDVTGKDRAWLLAHPEHELTRQQVAKLKNLLKRRAAHEPLAYLRGKTEFYGREFVLTSAVLEPRPESETMIDMLKKLPIFAAQPSARTAPVTIIDVGTGSGAIGITAQLELPNCRVELVDIDKNCLKVVKMNVDLHTTSMSVTHSDLLTNITLNPDVLLCNLPYVPDSYQINEAALHEPKLAIFGGPDGLDHYRRLFQQAQKLTDGPLYILTEALPPQHHYLAEIARHHDYIQEAREDFVQLFVRDQSDRQR